MLEHREVERFCGDHTARGGGAEAETQSVSSAPRRAMVWRHVHSEAHGTMGIANFFPFSCTEKPGVVGDVGQWGEACGALGPSGPGVISSPC